LFLPSVDCSGTRAISGSMLMVEAGFDAAELLSAYFPPTWCTRRSGRGRENAAGDTADEVDRTEPRIIDELVGRLDAGRTGSRRPPPSAA